MESPFRASDLTGDFRVIETLRWQGGRAIRGDRHLARAQATCHALGIPFDRARIAALLDGPHGTGPDDPGPLRLRLTIDRHGTPQVEAAPLAGPPPALWRVALAPWRLAPDDIWLRHKTSQRALYDQARAALPKGIDEYLFANTEDELCEGAITSVFFDLGEGLMTPPLACGLLPGVLRAEMLDAGTCREGRLPLADLARARLWVGNSLRGLIPARLAG
ncbi:aminotransferase class IV family protein [Alkalilacustris brevis]|uniref:aminotransferase class IV family protein n=1 Tax=Alkalilacustris brevis TaxID=2026338 RepID=UPI000E0DC0E2|nr:aminotransferase class IV family protein [Alkalilacustris brevis]